MKNLVKSLPGVARRAWARFGVQGRIAVIGLAVAAALIVIALVVWSSAPRATAEVAASGPMPTIASSTPTPTPSPAPVANVSNQQFKSNSGNLRCSIGTFSGQPGAICQQVNYNYAVPWGACMDQYQAGVFVGVSASGAYWPCVSYWPEPADVLAYDTPISQNGITCSINLDTGVTCTNESGNGFTMEYNAGVTQF